MSRVLGTENLDDIFSITQEASSDWKRIGLALRLRQDDPKTWFSLIYILLYSPNDAC